jgi:hypothetical protein
VLHKLHPVFCLIAICVYEVNRLYVEKKKNSNTGNFYVEQIINMPSRLGNQRGGDWGEGGLIDFHKLEEVVVCFNKVDIKSFVYHIHIPTYITTSIPQTP